jgi:hypothetical protein
MLVGLTWSESQKVRCLPEATWPNPLKNATLVFAPGWADGYTVLPHPSTPMTIRS